MRRTPLDTHPCSIARTLDIAGEWWTPLILRDVAYGLRRFGEIQEDLAISANVLSDRLDALVSNGLLERREYQLRPSRHEYRLTGKGADLLPALVALMEWGDRWTWPGGKGPVRVVHESCGHAVRVQLRCEECDREVAPGELRAKLRHLGGGGPAEHEPGHLSARRLAAGRDGVKLNP